MKAALAISHIAISVGVTHTFSDIRHCRSLGTSVFKMKWVKLAPQGFILRSTHYCAQKSGIKISED